MQRAKAIAISSYIAGGLLAAGSAAMFILSGIDQNRYMAACLPSFAAVGADCRFTF